jgi:serine/threonine-protein kinase
MSDQGFYDRAKAVFVEAIRRPREERGAFVEEAGESAEVRQHVATLLAHYESGALREPGGVWQTETAQGAQREGLILGAYRALSPVGRGGSGAVFRGERIDGLFAKTVAIKFLHRGLHDPETVARFHHERRIVAAIDHPYVVRLYDGGTTPDGLPYLVMEYVEGRPISTYCDERGLSVEARLRLLLEVCEGVESAHRQMVVHRDLKPSNILVTDEGEPRILDFGAARLLPAASGAASTHPETRLVTLNYASPELLFGHPTVGVGADVYAVGVILYELLCGSLPHRLDLQPPLDIAERLAGEQIAPPSRAAEEATRPERWGLAATDGLRHRLAGDLDAIVLRALRYDPDDRYLSIRELAEDLRRFLEGRPVTARPLGTLQRGARFVRRRPLRALVAVATPLLGVGLIALHVSTVTAERDLADRERLRAEQATRFLVGALSDADQQLEVHGQVDLEALFRRAAANLDEAVAAPADRAQMLHSIGAIYREIGLYDDAVTLLERALAAKREIFERGDQEIADTLEELAWAYRFAGQLETAEPPAREALAMRLRAFGPGHLTVARARSSLAMVLVPRGKYEEAERELLEARAVAQALDGGEEVVRASERELAHLYRLLGRNEEAVELLRGLLAAERRLGRKSVEEGKILNDLALTLGVQGHYQESEELFQQALERQRSLLGDSHQEVAIVLNNLAVLHQHTGDLDAAERELARATVIRRQVLGQDHPSVTLLEHNLGSLYYQRRDYPSAAKLLRHALEATRGQLGDDHLDTASTALLLGKSLHRLGEHGEAEELLRGVIATRRRVLGDARLEVAQGRCALANLLADMGRYAEALSVAETAAVVLREHLPADHWELAANDSIQGLARAGLGEPDGVARLRRAHAALEEHAGRQAVVTEDALRRLESVGEPRTTPPRSAAAGGSTGRR